MDQSKLWKEKPQTLVKQECEGIHSKEENRWTYLIKVIANY
jgi:hypothetical protein